MAEEEYSDAQRHNIAAHFIKAAPPAQAHKVVEEISVLVPDLPDSKKAAGMAAFNMQNGTVLSVPGHEQGLLLCKFSHVTGNKFLHGHSKQVYTVDHLTGEVADPEDPPAPTFRDDVEGLRVALETALVASVATTFDCSQKNSVGISVLPSVDGLTVVVSAKKSRLTAFWAGRWLATFSVKNIAPGSADISGSVDVVTHYYESGNVQLRSDKSWELVGVTGGGDAGLAAALVSQIEQWSAEYQAALDTMIASMGGSLKSLRRALPLTGSKMSWNLAQHANVGMLKGVASAAAGK